jgi:hypothetical protein
VVLSVQSLHKGTHDISTRPSYLLSYGHGRLQFPLPLSSPLSCPAQPVAYSLGQKRERRTYIRALGHNPVIPLLIRSVLKVSCASCSSCCGARVLRVPGEDLVRDAALHDGSLLLYGGKRVEGAGCWAREDEEGKRFDAQPELPLSPTLRHIDTEAEDEATKAKQLIPEVRRLYDGKVTGFKSKVRGDSTKSPAIFASGREPQTRFSRAKAEEGDRRTARPETKERDTVRYSGHPLLLLEVRH